MTIREDWLHSSIPIKVETIRLQFYLKCPKCGVVDRGTPDGMWLVYVKVCPKCDRPMIPDVRTEESKREG